LRIDTPWFTTSFNGADLMRLFIVALLGSIAICVGRHSAWADERLEGIACRSVHLAYEAPEGEAFYCEVTAVKTAPGTYFATCGWNQGYFGMQELARGAKLLIFSVWDSRQNDPRAVEEQERVKVLHQGQGVRIGRFGGEGTGGQSFFDYDWKLGDTYRFLVTSKINENRIEYAGYFYVPEESAWKHLVTFSTITQGQNLRGYYSFVEDFKRDRVSATLTREARFGNAWVKPVDGPWEAVRRARFTADANPVLNIDAGVAGDRFFLATGGAIENSGAKLRSIIELPKRDSVTAPSGLPGVQ
jgi:hypothetical protein